MAGGEGAPLLERLGLHRAELRAWALYDWANSAFVTTVVTAVFPVYFAGEIAAGRPPTEATSVFALASSLAMVIATALSPLLGVVADRYPIKKASLLVSAGVGVLASLGLSLVGRGDVAASLGLFVVGNVGLMMSFVFYDALLPHIASDDEADRVSTAGYAIGYLGGGLLLLLDLAFIVKPAMFGFSSAVSASKAAFVSVALWWAVFSVPLAIRVPEPPVKAGDGEGVLSRLWGTVRELRALPEASWLLAAFFFYNDGIGTIYRMAAIYGGELGLSRDVLIGTLAVTQLVSIPFAFAFGFIAGKIGTKRAILLALAVYVVIVGVAFDLRTERGFFALAMLVAMVQGGAQSLSRSLFATLIPRERSAQLFGLFGVLDKVSGVLGPSVFALVSSATGSSRWGVLSVGAFFVLGASLLTRVDVERGRTARG